MNEQRPADDKKVALKLPRKVFFYICFRFLIVYMYFAFAVVYLSFIRRFNLHYHRILPNPCRCTQHSATLRQSFLLNNRASCGRFRTSCRPSLAYPRQAASTGQLAPVSVEEVDRSTLHHGDRILYVSQLNMSCTCTCMLA